MAAGIADLLLILRFSEERKVLVRKELEEHGLTEYMTEVAKRRGLGRDGTPSEAEMAEYQAEANNGFMELIAAKGVSIEGLEREVLGLLAARFKGVSATLDDAIVNQP